jgi:bacteriocin-like protein
MKNNESKQVETFEEISDEQLAEVNGGLSFSPDIVKDLIIKPVIVRPIEIGLTCGSYNF